MIRSILLLLLMLPVMSKSQNLPQCDSLIITCCAFDSLGQNTVSIYVANPSSELFDYPGFVLLNAGLDTIAKETVNYFGIGTWPQAHTLSVVAPLMLPFEGFLELHTLFYQEFACSFPFTIKDTATVVLEPESFTGFVVFPNPADDVLQVVYSDFYSKGDVLLSIADLAGREMMKPVKMSVPAMLDLPEMQSGVFLLRITDSRNQFVQVQKVMIYK